MVDSQRSRVDVISPAYHETKNLESIVKSLVQISKKNHGWNYSIYLCVNRSDSSGTIELAQYFAKKYFAINVVIREGPPAIGRAIIAGLKAGEGEVVVPMMSDGADDPNFIPEFLEKIESGYDIVYGNRFLNKSDVQGYGYFKKIMNRTFNLIVCNLFNIKSTDITNGFKAYRREIFDTIGIDNLTSYGFEFAIEFPIRAKIHGFNSTEIPVSWHERTAGESHFFLPTEGFRYCKRLAYLYYMSVFQ